MKSLYALVVLLVITFNYKAQTNLNGNIGFELGNTNGWTLHEGYNTNSTTMTGCCPSAANHAFVVTSGVDQNIVTIPTVSPGGGNYALRLGSTQNSTGLVTRAKYSYMVSAASPGISCRYAFITDVANELCNSSAYFDISLTDANNVPLPNTNVHVIPQSAGCVGDPTFIQSGTYQHKNWSAYYYDLTNYIGTYVTLEFTVGESVSAGQRAYAYIDAASDLPQFIFNGNTIPSGQTISHFCAGSTGTLCAPGGSNYSWSGPNVTGQTGQCVTMSTAGTYSVNLSQGTNVANIFVNFIPVDSPTISVTKTDDISTCSGPCTGSVAVSTNTVNCDWNFFGNGLTASPVNTPSFSVNNLCGGNYTLTVQQAGTPIACPVTTVITLQGSSSGPPSINPVNQTLTCSNLTVTLDANPAFSNSPVDYAWSGPGITGTVNTQTISANLPGTYTVIATNTLTGCSTTSLVVVSPVINNFSISVNASQGGILQCGQCVTLSPVLTGNVPGVAFIWTSATGNIFNSLTIPACTAGTYSLSVTNANGCVASSTILVQLGAPLLTSSLTPTINATCPYLSNGSIQMSVSPAGTYTYTWSDQQNTVISSNADIFNLTAGMYFLKITDGSACAMYSYSVSNYNPSCSNISGNIFNDLNHDCVHNTGDANLSGVKVMATPGNYWALSDANGYYTIYAPLGSYTISQVLSPNSFITPYCSPALTTTLDTSTPQVMNVNFADTLQNLVDGKINSLNAGTGIVPGFNGNYYVSIGNTTPNGHSGILKFVKAPVLNYALFNPSPLSVNVDTAYFSVNTYTNPTQFFTIGFYAPPTLPLGTIIPACTYLKVNENDVNLGNNTLCNYRVVTGSFDPNDKSVEPAGAGPEGYINTNDSVLNYTVRFQNTGTGPAVNIVIEDTLSGNLNPLTFELLGSSHNCDVNVLPGNILRWKFNNIMLPDSNTNKPASHGFVNYRIKQKTGNIPSTQIKNTAYIYFDFNKPVITNTTLNTIETITFLSNNIANGNAIIIYPNPTSGKLRVVYGQAKDKTTLIKLMDILGKEVLTTSNKEEIDLSDLENGIYFMVLWQGNNMLGIKKIIKR